jgi:hypothetical protein
MGYLDSENATSGFDRFANGSATKSALNAQRTPNDASVFGDIGGIASDIFSGVKAFFNATRKFVSNAAGEIAGDALRLAAEPVTQVLDIINPEGNWDQRVENFGEKWGTKITENVLRTPYEVWNDVARETHNDDKGNFAGNERPATFADLRRNAEEKYNYTPLAKLTGTISKSTPVKASGKKATKKSKPTRGNTPFYGSRMSSPTQRKRGVMYE